LVIVGVLSVCSGWFIKKKMKRVAQWLLWSSVIATVVSLLVKALVWRVRPSLAVFLEIGGSFPSFHATISLTAYGLFFYILASFYKKQRCLLLSLGVFFVVLISFSRIYLNVHYFSDVVWWLLLGMSAIILVKFQQDSTRIN
jgi:undecaprenyl-diphosphatase